MTAAMKNPVPFIVFCSLVFAGCVREKGPCEYTITEIEARVVSLEPFQVKDDTTLFYHIVLRFNESELAKKNQLLEDWVPKIKGKTNSYFLKNNNIKIGDIYPGTVSEILSGNCQPVYVSFNNFFKTD